MCQMIHLLAFFEHIRGEKETGAQNKVLHEKQLSSYSPQPKFSSIIPNCNRKPVKYVHRKWKWLGCQYNQLSCSTLAILAPYQFLTTENVKAMFCR